MEKYIIILLLLASIYYIQNKLKDTEGFADAPTQSLGGVDDSNAINTLAQIARKLMNEGLTVPGAMTTKGLFSSTAGSRFTGNRNWFQDEEGKGRVRVGAAWGIPGIYAEDGTDLVLGAGSTNTHIGPPGNGQHLTVNGNLNVVNDVIFPNATTIRGKARLHIGGEELLFLLNKAGVIVSNAWGGNGNLQVDGALTVSGRNILAELNALNAKTANLNLGDYTIGPESEYLVIRRSGRDGRWAYRSGTNWG